MGIQINLTDDVTYDGNGNVIEVNGKKIAKGAKAAKTAVRDRVLKNIKDTLFESKIYASDIQDNAGKWFLRSPSNDYVVEVTAKKDEDTKRAIAVMTGGAVSEYAAGLLRLTIQSMREVPDCEILWAEGSKVRVHFSSGDLEIKVVKKRDRIG